MKVIGKTTFNMVTELKNGKMDLNTRVITRRAERKDWACTLGLMEVSLLVNGLTIRSMVTESTRG